MKKLKTKKSTSKNSLPLYQTPDGTLHGMGCVFEEEETSLPVNETLLSGEENIPAEARPEFRRALVKEILSSTPSGTPSGLPYEPRITPPEIIVNLDPGSSESRSAFSCLEAHYEPLSDKYIVRNIFDKTLD